MEHNQLINQSNSQIPGQLTFDEALEKVGASNKYQKAVFLYFGLQWFIANWVLFSPVYLFMDPQIDCKDNPDCISKCKTSDGEFDYRMTSCYDYICKANNFDFVQVGPTITTSFDTLLICDNSNLSSLFQSLVYIGSLIGFFIFSFIGDNLGRKMALQYAWLSATIGILILGLAQNLTMIGIGVFLIGFGINPSITIHFSFINEHTLGEFRDIQNIGVQVFFALGEIAMVGIGYYFPGWRILTLVWFGVPILALNFGIFFVLESPKFAYSKSKAKGVKILNKIAKINGKPKITVEEVEDNPQQNLNTEKVYSVIDLIRYPSIRWKFISGAIMFFGTILVYYGISFASDSVGFSFYINQLVFASFELVAYLITDVVIVKLKRRLWIIIGFALCGALSISYNFFPDDLDLTLKVISTILAGIMRFIMSCVLSLSYIYLSELFPTVIRTIALSVCSAIGAIGSISCPFIKEFSKTIGINPIIVFGIIGLVTGCQIFFLKETLDKPLRDEIEEESNPSMVSDADANRKSEQISMVG